MTKLCMFDADKTLFTDDAFFELYKEIFKHIGRKGFKDKEHFDLIQKKYNAQWKIFLKEEFKITEFEKDIMQTIWFEKMIEYYSKYTKLHDGVFDLIGKLKNNGVKVAIATNNNVEVIRESVTRLIGDDIPIHCRSQYPDNYKPKPDMLLDHMNNFGITPENTYMIGDSREDGEAAKAAGVNSVLASYDSILNPIEHKDIFDSVIATPLELLDIIK